VAWLSVQVVQYSSFSSPNQTHPRWLQEDFLALADRIAASYAGFNASAGACEVICRTGAVFALKDAPANLAFFSVHFFLFGGCGHK
jgi:hypothetical protein